MQPNRNNPPTKIAAAIDEHEAKNMRYLKRGGDELMGEWRNNEKLFVVDFGMYIDAIEPDKQKSRNYYACHAADLEEVTAAADNAGPTLTGYGSSVTAAPAW